MSRSTRLTPLPGQAGRSSHDGPKDLRGSRRLGSVLREKRGGLVPCEPNRWTRGFQIRIGVRLLDRLRQAQIEIVEAGVVGRLVGREIARGRFVAGRASRSGSGSPGNRRLTDLLGGPGCVGLIGIRGRMGFVEDISGHDEGPTSLVTDRAKVLTRCPAQAPDRLTIKMTRPVASRRDHSAASSESDRRTRARSQLTAGIAVDHRDLEPAGTADEGDQGPRGAFPIRGP